MKRQHPIIGLHSSSPQTHRTPKSALQSPAVDRCHLSNPLPCVCVCVCAQESSKQDVQTEVCRRYIGPKPDHISAGVCLRLGGVKHPFSERNRAVTGKNSTELLFHPPHQTPVMDCHEDLSTAVRYDQKSISRYFAKLYQFHGI